MKLNQTIFLEKITELVDEHFPKGISKERGHALVLLGELAHELTVNTDKYLFKSVIKPMKDKE